VGHYFVSDTGADEMVEDNEPAEEVVDDARKVQNALEHDRIVLTKHAGTDCSIEFADVAGVAGVAHAADAAEDGASPAAAAAAAAAAAVVDDTFLLTGRQRISPVIVRFPNSASN
jgi:hypothetical protein